jgi:hypothetical protein
MAHIVQVLALPNSAGASNTPGACMAKKRLLNLHEEKSMLRKKNLWNGRRVALALGMLCLAGVVLAACNSKSTSAAKPHPTPSPTARAVVALPAGFTTFKSATFHVAYPSGWKQANPPNGTGVEYTGPTNQVFAAASLGKIQQTPQAFDTAFCGQAGFGGTPTGAMKLVKISGASWMQQECTDAKGGKTAVVESTVYNKNFYYIAYGSQTASFQANRTHYFSTMEQSFTFTA